MQNQAIAAMALIGLLAAGCNEPPAVLKQDTLVADKPGDPTAPDPFASAVNFECDGGAKIDVAFGQGAARTVIYRVDGGAPKQLEIDESAQTGMVFKDASATLDFSGPDLSLTSGGSTRACKFAARALLPPAVPGVVRELKQEDVDAAVTMKVGQKLSISLMGVPTAGYLWAADGPPAFVRVTDASGGATSSAQFLPGFAGGNHWEVLVVEALARGQAEIALVQKRPWEDKPDPSDRRWKFKLVAE